MPVLNKNNRSTKTIKLKSYEGAEVTMYTSLLMGELENFDKEGKDFDKIAYMLPKLIKEWNFTDEDGKALEPNLENIKMLSTDALEELTSVIEKNEFEAKKD